MIVPAGSTAHFNVSYESSLAYTQALATDVLNRCEADLATLAGIWTATPVPATLNVTIVNGGGGGSHVGTDITLHSNSNTDAPGISSLLVAEVDEVFMSEQVGALGKGFNPGYSHGEGLSRVLAAELYPAIAGRWGVGLSWLNSNPRPDWVSATDPTDQNGISYGCASLFINYLHYQLGFTWQQIVAAADNTLALVAQNLGITNAYNDFVAVLARHFPVGTPVSPAQLPHDPEGIAIDNLYPLSCLYIRHNLADDGTSHTGPLSVSPDIIVKNNAVANPQATYSTPASIANDQESDPNVIDTQNNFVYLRVWNLGADATSVTATAYWSQVATLVTPSMWNLIGQAPYPDVPAGRMVKVSVPGLTWTAANIPAPGHYCFIATVGHAGDPAPTPASFASFDDFVAYIEANNNITWRNFNVVAIVRNAPSPGGHRGARLPFLLAGAWDDAREFEFEMHAALPPASRLHLVVPAHVAGRIAPAPAGLEAHEDAEAHPELRRGARIPLDPHGPSKLGAVHLEAGAALPSHLLVQIPEGRHEGGYRVAVRQTYRGREVGRITWLLVPHAEEHERADAAAAERS
jgi:hypothetical protein